MKPNCYNRPPFKDTVLVQDGWVYEMAQDELGRVGQIRMPRMIKIPDPMSKTCQQHGQMGEATLHPEKWDCTGCVHKPKDSA